MDLDYQEKLRLAKEALDSGSYDKETIEYIFPELKENRDERVKKAIGYAIGQSTNSDGTLINGVSSEEAIDWLEKQGERPNPYSGTSFEYNGHIWGMCARDNGVDILLDKQLFKHLENQGEQKIVSKTEPIVEGLTTEFQKQVSHLIASAMDKEHEYTKGYVEWVAQSLLGYAKNELTFTDEIKPKFKVGDKINMINREEEEYTILTITSINMDEKCYICNQGSVIDFDEEGEWYKIEQKPAWSEEDEKILNDIDCCISFFLKEGSVIAPACETEKEKALNWLKSLKGRIQPQPKQEWSEEDDKHLSIAIQYVFEHGYLSTADWLKLIKERLKGK